VNVDIQPLNVEVRDGDGPNRGDEVDGCLIHITDRESLEEAKGRIIGAEMFQKNEELLVRYLSARRLSQGTKASYGTAVRSFTTLVGAPLIRAGREEFEEWYRLADASGLAASTIVLYTSRLRKILVYALTHLSSSKAEAKAKVMIALEGVPLQDLHREVKLMERWLDKLLTPGELEAIMREAVHPRARALLPVLYETACRKGEILGSRIRDVSIGSQFSTIKVFGKTGQRTLPLVRSVPALEAWIDVHPDPCPRSPLFATVVNGEVRRMNDRTPNKLMAELGERVGLRHISPHMLRHTRLTELAAAGVGEFVLKSFAGWTQNSDMAARYVHFSGRTHIPAILRLEGIDMNPSGREGPQSVGDVYGVLENVLKEATSPP